MKILIFVIFFIESAFALADDKALTVLKVRPEFKGLSQELMSYAANNAVWNKNNTGFAFCYFLKKSFCYIIYKDLFFDVSAVEGSNLGKLGTADKFHYQRFETKPVSWDWNEDDKFSVKFTTHVWNNKKRYSTSEILIIKNGEVMWR